MMIHDVIDFVRNDWTRKGSWKRRRLAREIRALRRKHGQSLSHVWHEALEDFSAEEQLSLCQEIPAHFMMPAERDAHDRSSRNRSQLEDACLLLVTRAKAMSVQHRAWRQIEAKGREASILRSLH